MSPTEESMSVLVIDDSVDDQMFYRRVLKQAFGDRLRLEEEVSGESGLAAIERNEPRCVLLDYSLPGRNGIEVLKLLRAKHPHLPVVLLTGQGSEAVAVQSMKEGAQDYITKASITPESLGRVIRMAIDNSALQRRVGEQHAALELFTEALAHDLREPVRTVQSLVDDRDDDVLFTRTFITGPLGMHCNFLVAHDGKAGLATIRDRLGTEDPVDLILLDINMPVMNGFEMLEAMGEDAALSHIPVVMCSGSTRERDVERSRSLGALGYLAKPVRFEHLQPIIAKSTRIRLAESSAGQPVLMRVA